MIKQTNQNNAVLSHESYSEVGYEKIKNKFFYIETINKYLGELS